MGIKLELESELGKGSKFFFALLIKSEFEDLDNRAQKENIIEAGMDDYIAKPVARNSIQNAVNKWLIKNEGSKEKCVKMRI